MTADATLRIIQPVWVWGVPLAPLTFEHALDRVEMLIASGQPHYFITANLHYAMLTARTPRLDAVNREADFIVADGMPLVWASRWRSVFLPERVAGSDLVPALCERAARQGWRVFFLGGAPEVVKELTRKLPERFPGLAIAGIESPPFRPLSDEEHRQLLDRIRASRPHLLFVAFGQPKGEFWMADHYRELGVPACVQIGATVDFLADRVPRAPRWIQRIGLEWAYRLYREPRRLLSRYTANIVFALRMLGRDICQRRANRA